MKNQPPCTEWEDRIGLRYEDLSSQEQTSLNEHLLVCELCRNAQHDYDFLTERIHALPPPTVKPLPRLSLPLYEEDEHRAVDRHSVVRYQPSRGVLSIGLLLACITIVFLPLLFLQYRDSLGDQVPIGTTITTYNGHSNWVHTLVWSGNDETIASVGDDYTVHVWNAKNGENIFTSSTGSSSAIALSPDGNEVAFVEQSQANAFVVKDIWTGNEMFTYKDAEMLSISLLAWSPDGKKIVFADDVGNVQILSVSQKQPILTEVYNSISALAWSPDSSRLGLANFQGEVQVWDIRSGGKVITRYTDHTGSVSGLAWSPDGTSIASASFDNTVRVWDARNGKVHFVYREHTASVSTVAWSPDGNRIASGGGDGTVQVWDVMTGNNRYVYTGHTSPVSSVVWSPDGKYVASCSQKTVKVWVAS